MGLAIRDNDAASGWKSYKIYGADVLIFAGKTEQFLKGTGADSAVDLGSGIDSDPAMASGAWSWLAFDLRPSNTCGSLT
ncbi:hypothetical protein LRP30_32640 [Bradyrhizobium sp. C-145]|uniref:hypothetical protein n=1 Tax=Bradyrhizobium sp. C-145 TaxID=574727 RepID=UPI00201B6B08|nr:hypothetical protein [Bradyrhizobium sp. C-145]UQR61549.1 hypothetical protein LRP30_32640 [Bradyrhizobium sp. C-145]